MKKRRIIILVAAGLLAVWILPALMNAHEKKFVTGTWTARKIQLEGMSEPQRIEDAAKNSLDSIKYKPILANFTDQTEDGEWDFTSHDIEINDDGTYEYIEKQVGCFTADEAILKYDEEEKKNFVFAKMAIPKDYTMTADILKRKNGSKVSVELTVNEMSYNAKTKTLDLTDIEVKGCTLLGTDPYTQKPRRLF